MNCYTSGNSIIKRKSNVAFLVSLERQILALENSQVRLNAYGGMELNDNYKKINALQDRIDSINWTASEINFNESKYDV